jgi:hypothetical protein
MGRATRHRGSRRVFRSSKKGATVRDQDFFPGVSQGVDKEEEGI